MGEDQVCTKDDRLQPIDHALLHALQVDPRAPWARIAQVLGVDAATVARRWAALAEAGVAWFTVRPASEPDVEAGEVALVRVLGPVAPEDEVAWCAEPWVLSVERTSVGLVLLVVGQRGLAALDADIRASFSRPGLEVRVEYASAVPRGDSCWRVGALTEQQARLLEPAPTVPERIRPAREEVVDEVTALLREDARMSLGAVASRLGVSDATARRTLERLLALGLVRLGCDVAMPRLGLGYAVVLRLDGPARAHLDEKVLDHPRVHRVVSTVGPVRAAVGVRVRSLAEVEELEEQWPGVRVVDRWTVTGTLKRNGHLLGPDGRSVGLPGAPA